MLVYLDMCCLKRPFDDQSLVRNFVETEALLSVLAAEGDKVQFVRSGALFLENSLNPLRSRAEKVAQWLRHRDLFRADEQQLVRRTTELMQLGFKNLDALHVSTAELAQAALFGTCDDKLLSAAQRNVSKLRLRVLGIVELAAEINK
jgi:hypothetical protein